jgi:hypothetical protein
MLFHVLWLTAHCSQGIKQLCSLQALMCLDNTITGGVNDLNIVRAVAPLALALTVHFLLTYAANALQTAQMLAHSSIAATTATDCLRGCCHTEFACR